MLNLINGKANEMLAPDGAGSGSAEGGAPAPANADLLTNAFAGADGQKPAEKPDGEKNAGGTGTGSGSDNSDLKLSPWSDQLPAEMRNNPETAAKFAKFGKVGDMAKAYLELEGKANGVVIPGKDATAQATAEFWEKVGKPKAADGYSFSKDTDSDGASFAQAAFASNLTEGQAAAMLKNLQEIGLRKQQSYLENSKRQQAEAAAELEKEYGSRYKENMELLSRGLASAGPNVARLLADAGLSGEIEIIKAFIAFGKMTAESGAPKGGEAGASLQSVFDGGTFDYKE